MSEAGVDAEAVGQPETGDPTDGREQTDLAWGVSALQVSLEQGAAVYIDIEFELDAPLSNAHLRFDPSIADLVGSDFLAIGDLLTGGQTHLLSVNAPDNAPAGLVISGEISLTGDSAAFRTALPLQVRIVPLDQERAARHLRIPSRERIVETSLGAIVKNQITAFLDGDAERAAEVAAAHGAQLVGSSPEAGIYQFQVDGAESWEELLGAAGTIAEDVRVVHASPSSLTDSVSSPSDEEWRTAWNRPNGSDKTWHIERARIPEAWELANGNPARTSVAILDVGFDLSHEDLTFSVTDGRMRMPADRGHGTHVAGIACADSDNEIGVAGTGWNCDLRAYNVFISYLSYEEGYTVRLSNDLIWEAMAHAARDGARVANLSFAYKFQRSPEICRKLDDPETLEGQRALNDYEDMAVAIQWANRLAEREVLWVTAAGNDACEASMVFPASIAHVPQSLSPSTHRNAADTTLSVAATNRDGLLAGYSNHSTSTTIAAPGGDDQGSGNPSDPGVHSTTACSAIQVSVATREPGPCSAYGFDNGTSMAAPLVTGVAALMFSANPDLTAAQAKTCLVESARERTVPGHLFGIIDAAAAVECARNRTRDRRPEEPKDTMSQSDVANAFFAAFLLGDEEQARRYTSKRASPDAYDDIVKGWSQKLEHLDSVATCIEDSIYCHFSLVAPTDVMVVELVEGQWTVTGVGLSQVGTPFWSAETSGLLRYCVTDTRPLNLRTGPGVDYAAMTTIPVDDCEVYADFWRSSEPWLAVHWQDRVGFVATDRLTPAFRIDAGSEEALVKVFLDGVSSQEVPMGTATDEAVQQAQEEGLWGADVRVATVYACADVGDISRVCRVEYFGGHSERFFTLEVYMRHANISSDGDTFTAPAGDDMTVSAVEHTND